MKTMTKMKLCPIEPSDDILVKAQRFGAWTDLARKSNEGLYKAMTAECETVEVVDQESVFKFLTEKVKEEYGLDTMLQFTPCVGRMNGLLHENGYQIIRKVER